MWPADAVRPSPGTIEHMFGRQASLFGGGDVAHDGGFAGLRRHELDDNAWLDLARGWLAGDEVLFDVLRAGVAWEQPVVRMYEREVVTPRLVGKVDPSLHPEIERMSDTLSERYGVALDRISAGFYRSGSDGVAWHGDRIARERPASTVATVSLAGPRTFRIRPKGGGTSRCWSLGHGDLVVMGGSCQRDWEHTVPKAAHAPPRIALMFRHRYA